jgi:hypothetical protein
MSAHELASRVEELIISANKVYEGRILRIQDQLYSRVLNILKDLELDNDGFVKQTSANRSILRNAQSEFDEFINNSTYQSALEDHLKIVNKIDVINSDYFTELDTSFKPNRAFIASLQKNVISDLNSLILQDGLQAQVKLPLNEILNRNINTGGNFSGFVEEIRLFIKGGPEIEGTMVRYARTIVKDTLFNYSRAYQDSITEDLGLEFYVYSGGLMDKSREFCIERSGEYFHYEEVQEWADKEWAGKRKGTTTSSIFIFAGGWNCSHSLIPVDISAVPQDVIDRATKKGFYRP